MQMQDPLLRKERSAHCPYLLTGVVPRGGSGRLGVPEPGSELAGASLGSSAASPCSAALATAARSSSTGSVKALGGPCSSACKAVDSEHVRITRSFWLMRPKCVEQACDLEAEQSYLLARDPVCSD